MDEQIIDIYNIGIGFISVCVPREMTREKIELKVNLINPTGIESKWKISIEKFSNGDNNPCICNNHIERLHYLLSC